MERKTSITAYREIQESGLVGRLQRKVYNYLYEHGPCTQMDVVKELERQGYSDRSVTPRFAELQTLGIAEPLPEEFNRSCTYSGKIVMQWDVTGHSPKKVAKPEKKSFWIVVDSTPTFWPVHRAYEQRERAEAMNKGERIIEVEEV